MSSASVAVVVTSGERHEGKAGLQVILCDPYLSALCVPWCKKALYKYSSFPFPFYLFVAVRRSAEATRACRHLILSSSPCSAVTGRRLKAALLVRSAAVAKAMDAATGICY